MLALKFALFTLLLIVVLYGYNSLLARRFFRPDLKIAGVYFCTTALIGVAGEIFLDSVYNAVVGNPLWRYNILPVHGGYTSAYAPIIWGVYGLHIYMFHALLDTRKVLGTVMRSLIFSVEALVVESLLTLSAVPVFGQLMYYYYPSDLWHVTSIQNMPFYFICGIVLFKTLKRFKKDPRFFIPMCMFLTVVIVYLT